VNSAPVEVRPMEGEVAACEPRCRQLLRRLRTAAIVAGDLVRPERRQDRADARRRSVEGSVSSIERRSEPRRGNGERVLFVDDEPSIARFVGRHLTACGYVTTTETEPGRALALVRADPAQFDVVVTDCHMPGLTGIELAREIHRLSPTLPIVLLSGHLEELDQDEMARIGVVRTALKPIRPAALASLTFDALHGH